MNREERIKAALNSQEVDRIPISVWMHFSEFDQDRYRQEFFAN